ncbi:MAG TPA: division/cell wall cluster transcriptional repressor MraZ [Dysgonamonadaceae bacterium]|nr:division/cell wall cluster transcriptional repressor MraZ [Dysgonamonadaceae bacterium]
MNQFLGNFEAKVDAKGRVFVPAAFRKLLQLQGEDWLVLRKDIFQDCLVLYPGSVWEEEIEVLRSKLNKWNRVEQQVFRQFVLDAERIEMDGSGRILVSRRYLELAQIDAHVRFLGVDNTIEVWAKDKLDRPLMEPEVFADEIQKLME